MRMIRVLDEEALRRFVEQHDPMVVWVGILGDPGSFKEVFRGAWREMRYPASLRGTPGFTARMESGALVTRACWCAENKHLREKRKAAEAVPYAIKATPTISMIYEMRARARGQRGVAYA